jgi:hypothetical protein
MIYEVVKGGIYDRNQHIYHLMINHNYTRLQARRICNMLLGWRASGYVPAGLILP